MTKANVANLPHIWQTCHIKNATPPDIQHVKDGNTKNGQKASKPPKSRRKKSPLSREGKQFLKAFGNRVRELREKEGISQDQLGYECGVDRTTILRIEKGHYETGITSLHMLAKALGVSETELVNFKKTVAEETAR